MPYSQFMRFIPAVFLFSVGLLLRNGLLVELAINWLLFLFIVKEDLSVLGLMLTKRRLIQFCYGFLLAVSIYFVNIFIQTTFSDSSWQFNQEYTLSKFWSAAWWTMRSVLYEELIFRGALLYIALKHLGTLKSCSLSAICFGVYHWFSMNAFGNWVFMVWVFAATAIMGFSFALAYAKTRSLYLPIALHFGWNFVHTVVFSQGPIGNQVLLFSKGELFNLVEQVIVLIVQNLAFPAAVFFYLRLLKRPRHLEKLHLLNTQV